MAIKLDELGGSDLQPDTEILAEDHNDTNREILKQACAGQAQQAYQVLQSNNVFENKGVLAAEEFVDEDGTNNTVRQLNENAFIIIEATDVPNVNNFSINDCVMQSFGTGKWLLYCTVGTVEEQRAKLYKTLFYGTGGNGRITSTYITGLTAVKTPFTRDVGKQAHYAQTSHGDGSVSSGPDGFYTGTFANTTTNLNCSTWSYLLGNEQNRNGTIRWEFPSGTSRHSMTIGQSADDQISDETGTDTTGDELDNPNNCQLQIDYTSSTSGDDNVVLRALILCEGGISWVQSGHTSGSQTNIDFAVDHSVPNLTLATETVNGTTAAFDTDNYQSLYDRNPAIETDTAHSVQSFTNVANAFDDNATTYAQYSSTTASWQAALGRTFAAQTIVLVYYRAEYFRDSAASGQYMRLQSFDGSTWNDELTISTSTSDTGVLEGFHLLNSSVQGLRIIVQMGGGTQSKTFRLYELSYGAYTLQSKVNCHFNTLDLAASDKAGILYVDGDTPAGTSFSCDIGNGGSDIQEDVVITDGISDLVDMSSFGAGVADITIKLNSATGEATPQLRGWGFRLLK